MPLPTGRLCGTLAWPVTTAADLPYALTLLMSPLFPLYVISGGTLRNVPPLLSHARLYAERGDAYV